MGDSKVQQMVDDATFDFTMGDTQSALEKLKEAIALDPDHFGAWHARAEILFSERDLDGALSAAEAAHEINPDDVHINTSLSRIWMERGDKETAEKFGARARVLGWKDQLKTEED